jgi:hypothetical protein
VNDKSGIQIINCFALSLKEMFLTGAPPDSTSGAGVEVAALATEMEEIIKAALLETTPRAAAG